MENNREELECQGCQSVKEIVSTNEQMIHEQIKLIKKLHEEN